MASDTRASKRKSGEASSRPSKIKKVEEKSVKTAKPSKALKPKTKVEKNTTTEKTDAVVNGKAKELESSRKHATDFFEEEDGGVNVESVAETAESKPSKRKKSATMEKATNGVILDGTDSAPTSISKTRVKTRKDKPKKNIVEEAAKVEEDIAPLEANEVDSESDDAGDTLEDQTAALIKGFESSDDEKSSDGEGLEKGRAVPGIPVTKKVQKKLDSIKKQDSEEPGTVYVGRIPHGFYEHQMREYFSQFGAITRLRLSRNRKTGASKHYAFVQFASADVAQIVADTMNNYLMFGHILKCKTIPKGQVHPELWKGADKRFKAIPWNRIQGRQLAAPKPREVWENRVQKEKSKRQSKAEKLKEIGYDFKMPDVQSVDSVPVRQQVGVAPTNDAAVASVIGKTEGADVTAVETTTSVQEEPRSVTVQETTVKTTKKGKKRKSQQ